MGTGYAWGETYHNMDQGLAPGLTDVTIHYFWNCRHTDRTETPAIAATCEADGATASSCCNFCGEVFAALEVIPALGHDYNEIVLNAPTCKDYGLVKYICKNDESHFYVDSVDPTTDHDYAAATGICSVCGGENPDFVPNPFTDVAENDYFFAPVLWALSKNVTTGTSATEFSPNADCSRGQVVTFLWRAVGKPTAENRDNPFTDVAEGDYYYEAVLWAVENGITSGMGEGIFAPGSSCTRAQVATFLWRAMGKPTVKNAENSFTDVAEDVYYYDAVLWAVDKGITKGMGEGIFAPDMTCTRGQIATFLYRALK